MTLQGNEYTEFAKRIRRNFRESRPAGEDAGADPWKFRHNTNLDFFVNGTVERLLQRDVLHQFYTTLYGESGWTESGEEEDRRFMIAEKGKGKEVDSHINEGPTTKETFATRMNLQPRKVEAYRFLAILLYSRCSIKAAKIFVDKILKSRTWPVLEGEETTLPADLDALLRLFSKDDASEFHGNQAPFCAAVIQKGKVVSVKPGHLQRLPFVEKPMPLGSGSQGEVTKVIVAEYHYLYEAPRDENNANPVKKDTPTTLACKTFKKTTAGNSKVWAKEHKVMLEIARSAEGKSSNIVELRGCLQTDETFSLFMPMARWDLAKFLNDNGNRPTSIDKKKNMIRSAMGLASGLNHLHENLTNADGDRIVCYHMDLKPANILIFVESSISPGQPEQLVHVWKLSDFGMTRTKVSKRFKEGTKEREEKTTQWFWKKPPDVTESDSMSGTSASGTVNQHGDGAFLAPESRIVGRQMKRKSDVWSLGCVLSVVFTFIEGGKEGKEEYDKLRRDTKGSGNRQTFYLQGPAFDQPKDHPGVADWHRQLVDEATKRDPREGEALRKILHFLQKEVLQVRCDDRCEAKQVRDKLEATREAYKNLLDTPRPRTPPPEPPQRASTMSQIKGFWKSRKMPPMSERHSKPTLLSITESHLPETSTYLEPSECLEGCEVSSDGKRLVYWTSQRLLLCTYNNTSPKDSTKLTVQRCFILPQGCTIDTVRLSAIHLVASVNPARNTFQCIIIHLHECRHQCITLARPKIHSLAISPGSDRIVFSLWPADNHDCGTLFDTQPEVLMNFDQVDTTTQPLAWHETDTRIVLGPFEEILVDHELFQAKELDCLSRGKHRKMTNLSISARGHIHFALHPTAGGSNASQQSTRIVRASPSPSGGGLEVSIFDFTIPNDDNGYISSQLLVAPCQEPDHPACVYITQQRYLSMHPFPPSQDQSLKFGNHIHEYRILQIWMGWDKDTVLYALGTKTPRVNPVLLLEIPLLGKPGDKQRQPVVLAEFKDLTSEDTFKAGISSYGGRGERFFIVTKLDMGKRRPHSHTTLYYVMLPDSPSA